jgi:hypothetical protein
MFEKEKELETPEKKNKAIYFLALICACFHQAGPQVRAPPSPPFISMLAGPLTSAPFLLPRAPPVLGRCLIVQPTSSCSRSVPCHKWSTQRTLFPLDLVRSLLSFGAYFFPFCSPFTEIV